MNQEHDKQLEIMPYNLKKGLGKYLSKSDEKMNINLRIIIIISVFSLILIFIGTIILLNSYSPKASSLNSYEITKYAATVDQGINVPSSATKTNLLSLNNKLASFETSLNTDNTNFDAALK